MKRTALPPLSPTGLEALASYEHWLCEREDLTAASIGEVRRQEIKEGEHFLSPEAYG